MQGITKKIVLGSAVLAFAAPAPALAQDSVVGGYNESEVVDPNAPGAPADPGDPQSQSQSQSQQPASSASSDPAGQAKSSEDSGGSLPFTGLDIGLLAVAGAALVALGFGMRRLTRNNPGPA